MQKKQKVLSTHKIHWIIIQLLLIGNKNIYFLSKLIKVQMKKKSYSLQKLPELSKLKKDKIILESKLFNEKMEEVDKIQKKCIEADFFQAIFLRRKSKILLAPYQRRMDKNGQSPRRSLPKIIRQNSATSSNKDQLTSKYDNQKDLKMSNQKQKLFLKTLSRKQFKLTTNQNLIKISSSSPFAQSKIDFQVYRTQKKQKQMQIQLKAKQSFKQRNRLFLPQKIEIQQKTTFPLHRANEMIETPFKKIAQQKLQQNDENTSKMIQIRFLDGTQKWIKQQKLQKRVYYHKDQAQEQRYKQPESLDMLQQNNLDYNPDTRKTSFNQTSTFSKNSFNISQTNFNSTKTIHNNNYLQKQLQLVRKQYASKKITLSQQMIQLLRQQLYYNYQASIKSFQKEYKTKRIVEHENLIKKSNPIQQRLKDHLQSQLYCSYDLAFIAEYNLKKDKYIQQFIESYSFINQIKYNFYHFQKLFTLNIEGNIYAPGTNKLTLFPSPQSITKQVNAFLKKQHDRIESHIFNIQNHIKSIENSIVKDIEYFIKLNPRYQNTDYKTPLKKFSNSISRNLGKITKSIVAQNLIKQFAVFVLHIQQWATNPFKGIQNHMLPNSNFYSHITVINHPMFIVLQSLQEREIFLKSQKRQNLKKIFRAPGIIIIQFQLKKLKRRRYANIYRFLLLSRKLIHQFDFKNLEFQKRLQKLQFFGLQTRITYQNPLEVIQKVIIEPIQNYFDLLKDTQNVNGCVNKSKLQFNFREVQEYFKQKQKLKQAISLIQKKYIQKYIQYFSLWQIYFSEKSYIDDLLSLYKRLNAIAMIKQEYKCLENDYKIITNFPDIIEFKFIRLNIKQIKRKIMDTILSHKNKILKQCQNLISKMLQFGFQQTIKAKKLVNIGQYSNLEEYVKFIEILNNRQMQKSIHKIAINILTINANMVFLEQQNYQVKLNTIKYYLECNSWVKQLRYVSAQNKKKVILDPSTFIKTITQKKRNIYFKYFKILKDIIELMKVVELKKVNRYSMLAESIENQMSQICIIVKNIRQDENILQIQYLPEINQIKIDSRISQIRMDSQNSDIFAKQKETIENKSIINVQKNSTKVYKSDLTFFQLEKKFLSKYLEFWGFYGKFKVSADAAMEKSILHVDGAQIIRLIRQGTQLSSKIRHSTLNKRFLNIIDEMNKQIEPFMKNFNNLHICISGSQEYRKKILIYFIKKLQLNIVDLNLITVKEFLAWSTDNICLEDIFVMRQKQFQTHEFFTKLSAFTQYLRYIEIKQKKIKIGQFKQVSLILIQNDMLNKIQYFKNFIEDFFAKFKYNREFSEDKQVQRDDSDYDHIQQVKKKSQTFYIFLKKFQIGVEFISKKFGLFQVILPITINSEQKNEFLPLKQYQKIYQNLLIDAIKKSELILKLGFFTIFNDKVKLNYTEEIKKLESCQILLFNNLFKKRNQIQNYNSRHSFLEICNLQVSKQVITQHLFNLNQQRDEKQLSKIFKGCQKVKFNILSDQQSHQENRLSLKITEFQTIFGENIITSIAFPLFRQEKQVITTIQEIIQAVNIEKNEVIDQVKDGLVAEQSQSLKQKQVELRKTEVIKQNIKSWFQIGIISHVNNYYCSMQKILKHQFFNYFYLIYSLHYNIKHIFQIYLSFNDILMQTIILSLSISFWMDLSFVWENKYDLNLFHSQLKDQIKIGYDCKQKQSQKYVKQIELLIRQFQTITRFINNIQSEYEQPQNFKLKKNLAFLFLAQIRFPEHTSSLAKCKKWIQEIKKQKQDDFIISTHQNPLINQNLFSKIDFNSLDLRQVEKKQNIQFSQLCQKASQFLLKNTEFVNFEINVQYPVLNLLQVQNKQKISFFPLNQLNTEHSVNYSYESCYSATFYAYSRNVQKMFVTNIEMNSNFLGRHFNKCYQYQYRPLAHLEVICKNQADLIIQLKKYHKTKLNIEKLLNKNQLKSKDIYKKTYDPKIKYNQAHQFEIQNRLQYPERFQQTLVYFYCEIFDSQTLRNLSFGDEIECLFIEKDGFHNLICSSNLFQRIMTKQLLQNLDSRSNLKNNAIEYFGRKCQQKLIQPSRFHNNLYLQARQREQFRQIIWKYNKNNRYTNQIDEEMFYAMKLVHFISEDISLIKEVLSIMNYHLLQESLNKPFQKKSDLQSLSSQLQQQKISMFVIPAYLIQLDDFIGYYHQQTTSVSIQDRFKSTIIHTENYRMKTYNPGVLQKILESIQKNNIHQDLFQYLHTGTKFTKKCIQWYVIDLTIHNNNSQIIFSFLRYYFMEKHSFTLPDGKSSYFSFTSQTKHKVIYLLSNQMKQKLSNFQTQLYPLPFIKLPRKFNPIRFLQMNINFTIIKDFDRSYKMRQKFISFINCFFNKQITLITSNNNQTAQQSSPYQIIKIGKLFSRQVIQLGCQIFNITLNEIRKFYIATGYYQEKQITDDQSLLNIFSSTQLRQKNKSKEKDGSAGFGSNLLHIQQIQKSLDQTRKRIYKMINQNHPIDDFLKKSIQESLQGKIRYFDPMLLDQNKLYEKILHSILFSLFYCLVLKKQEILLKQKKKQKRDQELYFQKISQTFIQQIQKLSKNCKQQQIRNEELQKYYFNIGSNIWQQWATISNQLLDHSSCTNSIDKRVLSLSQIIRLNSTNKKSYLKVYIEFLNKYQNKTPSMICSFNYRNYFAKIFALYQYYFEWNFEGLQQIQKSSLKKDILHMKNHYDQRLSLSNIFENQSVVLSLEQTQNNRKLNKIIQQIKVSNHSIFIVDMCKQSQRKIDAYKTVAQYKIFSDKRKLFNKVQNFHAIFYKDNQNQYSRKTQNISPNYFQILYSLNRSFTNDPNIFRQKFIGIIILLKTYLSKFYFQRSFRILDSLYNFNTDSPSIFLMNLYKMHGFSLYWASAGKKSYKIQSQQEFSRLKLTLIDIIQQISKIQSQSNLQNDQKQQIFRFISSSCQHYNLKRILINVKNSQQIAKQQFNLLKQNQIKKYLQKLFNFLIQNQMNVKLKLQVGQILSPFTNDYLMDQNILENSQNENKDEKIQDFPGYILRYLLKKPKKYSSILNQSPTLKKKAKKTSATKQSYNDLLPFSKELQKLNISQLGDQFGLNHTNLIKPLIFFQFQNQKFLLVKLKTSLTQNIYKKYIDSYKIYLKAKRAGKEKDGKLISIYLSQKDLFNMNQNYNITINKLKVKKQKRSERNLHSINNKRNNEFYEFFNQNFQIEKGNRNLLMPNLSMQRKEKVLNTQQQNIMPLDTSSKEHLKNLQQSNKSEAINELNFLILSNELTVDDIFVHLLEFENNRILVDLNANCNKYKPKHVERRYIIFVPSKDQFDFPSKIQNKQYECQKYIPSIVEAALETQNKDNKDLIQKESKQFQIKAYFNQIYNNQNFRLPILAKQLLQQKCITLYQKISSRFIQSCIFLLGKGNTFNKYIELAEQKLMQIKINTQKFQTQLDQKRDVIRQSQAQLLKASLSLQQLSPKISQSQKQLIKIKKTIFQIENKDKYYIGEKQFLEENRQLKKSYTSLKQLQKLLLSEEYLKQINNENFYFIIIFNVLADTSFYIDKYEDLIEIKEQLSIKNLNKMYLSQNHKKNAVRLINYGRLTAIIQNQSVINGDTISEEQLNFVMKISLKFTELKKIFSQIHQSGKYSEKSPYSLSWINQQANQQIQQMYWKEPLKLAFHKYLLTFFVHKYIRNQIIKKLKQSKFVSDNLSNAISSYKQKQKEFQISKTSTQNYLQSMKKKYQKNKEELQISVKNQEIFIETLQNNVKAMAQAQIYLKTGVQIQIKYAYSREIQRTDKKSKNKPLKSKQQTKAEKKKQNKVNIEIRDNKKIFYLIKDILFSFINQAKIASGQFDLQIISNFQLLMFINGIQESKNWIINNSIVLPQRLYQYLRVKLIQSISFTINFISFYKLNQQENLLKNEQQYPQYYISIQPTQINLPSISLHVDPLTTYALTLYSGDLQFQCLNLIIRVEDYYFSQIQKQLIQNRFISKIDLLNSKKLESIKKWKIDQQNDIKQACDILLQSIKKKNPLKLSTPIQMHISSSQRQQLQTQFQINQDLLIQHSLDKETKSKRHYLQQFYNTFQNNILQFEGNIRQRHQNLQKQKVIFKRILNLYKESRIKNQKVDEKQKFKAEEYYAKICGVLFRKFKKENNKTKINKNIKNIQQNKNLTSKENLSSVQQSQNSEFSISSKQQNLKSQVNEVNKQMNFQLSENMSNQKQNYDVIEGIFKKIIQNHSFGFQKNKSNHTGSLYNSNSIIQNIRLQIILLQHELTSHLFLIQSSCSYFYEQIRFLSQINKNYISYSQIQIQELIQNDQIIQQLLSENQSNNMKQKWIVIHLMDLEAHDHKKQIQNSQENMQNAQNSQHLFDKLKNFAHIVRKIKDIKKKLRRLSKINQSSKRIKVIIIITPQNDELLYKQKIKYLQKHVQPVYNYDSEFKSIQHMIYRINKIYNKKPQNLNEKAVKKYIIHLVQKVLDMIFRDERKNKSTFISSISLNETLIKKYIQFLAVQQQEQQQKQKQKQKQQIKNNSFISNNQLKIIPTKIINFIWQIQSKRKNQNKCYDLKHFVLKKIFNQILYQIYYLPEHQYQISKSLQKLAQKISLANQTYFITQQCETLALKNKASKSYSFFSSNPSTISIPKPKLSKSIYQYKVQIGQQQQQISQQSSIPAIKPLRSALLKNQIPDPTYMINNHHIEIQTNKLLSDPKIYIILNNSFRKVISKILKKRLEKHKEQMTGKNKQEEEQQQQQNIQNNFKINQIQNKISMFDLLPFNIRKKPKQNSLNFSQLCYECWQYCRQFNFSLEEIVIVMRSDNQSQLEFDSFVAKENIFYTGLNLINNIVLSDQVTQALNIKKNKSQKKTLQKKKKKSIELNLFNPLSIQNNQHFNQKQRRDQIQQNLQSYQNEEIGPNNNREQKQVYMEQKSILDKFKRKQISQNYYIMPRYELKQEGYKTEGINFKYFEKPELAKQVLSLDQAQIPDSIGSPEQNGEAIFNLGIKQKFLPQYITLIPIYYKGDKIGVFQTKTNINLQQELNLKQNPIILVIQ